MLDMKASDIVIDAKQYYFLNDLTDPASNGRLWCKDVAMNC